MISVVSTLKKKLPDDFQVIRVPKTTSSFPKKLDHEPNWWTINGETVIATDGSLAENVMKGGIVLGKDPKDLISTNVAGGSSSYSAEMGALFMATKILPWNQPYVFLIDNLALKLRVEEKKIPTVTHEPTRPNRVED